jgi:transposase
MPRLRNKSAPFEAVVLRWDQLPGINRRIAEVLIAEVGADLEQFPDADHLASWAGLCPGNNESGGKRKSGKTRKGNVWLGRSLVEPAHGAARSKHKYFSSFDERNKEAVKRRAVKRLEQLGFQVELQPVVTITA